MELLKEEEMKIEVVLHKRGPGKYQISHEFMGMAHSMTMLALVGELEIVKQELIAEVRRLNPSVHIIPPGHKS